MTSVLDSAPTDWDARAAGTLAAIGGATFGTQFDEALPELVLQLRVGTPRPRG